MTRIVAFASAIVLFLPLPGDGAEPPGEKQGTVYRAPSGTTLRLMLDDSNVGSRCRSAR